MSNNVVPRVYPLDEELEQIRFNLIDETDFGMINLCCWRDELHLIENIDQKVIESETIKIHFPMFDYFYAKQYRSQNGFTLRQLLDRIMKVARQAGRYDTQHNPEHYFIPNPVPFHFYAGYAITSSNTISDIQIQRNNVYISVQH